MTTRHDPALGRGTIISAGDPEAATRAMKALRAGQVVAIPTDTVYGLAAAITHTRAIERLYALKGRPSAKAIPILLDDRTRVASVACTIPPLAEMLFERFWPGALTVVIPGRTNLPSELTETTPENIDTVAVRVPDHPFARAVICGAGGALAVTSANRSGESPATNVDSIVFLGDAIPDLIVDGGDAAAAVASTIVLVLPSRWEIVREGAIPAATIREAIISSGASAEALRTIPPHTV